MRIIILSRSGELYSTRSLFNAGRQRNHFIRVVDHMACDLMVQNGNNKVFFYGQSLHDYDAIIPRIGHTVTKHGAAVIRQFESMNVFTTLGSDALILARDKMTTLQILSHHGIPIPQTLLVNNIHDVEQLHKKIVDFPKILKLVSGTHGLGVLKADDAQTLESLMETFYGLRQKMLIQEYIAESRGKDLRIIVVNGQVVASMMRSAAEGDFRSNLHRGGQGHSVLISEREKDVAIKATSVLGLSVAGVDMLRSSEGPLVIEVNASPGLEGIESISKINVAKHIIQFIEKEIKNKF